MVSLGKSGRYSHLKKKKWQLTATENDSLVSFLLVGHLCKDISSSTWHFILLFCSTLILRLADCHIVTSLNLAPHSWWFSRLISLLKFTSSELSLFCFRQSPGGTANLRRLYIKFKFSSNVCWRCLETRSVAHLCEYRLLPVLKGNFVPSLHPGQGWDRHTFCPKGQSRPPCI